jgi:hydroxymethylbilane synthase
MPEKGPIIVGSRPSSLAVAQAQIVIGLLSKELKMQKNAFKIKKISTEGDVKSRILQSEFSSKSDFTKAIDRSLLEGEIDIAVHSLKDVPIEDKANRGKIVIVAYPKRDSPFDVLVLKERRAANNSLETLEKNATIGTSSLRRIVQLKAYRPDLNIVGVRGNVETRIKKLKDRPNYELGGKSLDAIVLAEAGLRRLGLEKEIVQVIPKDIILPAPGQGCLAVSVRADDKRMINLVSSIDNEETRVAVTAERAFANELGGGCNTPVAALATFTKGKKRKITVEGMVANPRYDPDATLEPELIKERLESETIEDPEELGRELARMVKSHF